VSFHPPVTATGQIVAFHPPVGATGKSWSSILR
jgi:hypothetical protein